MEILGYIVLFVIVGFILRMMLGNDPAAYGVILIITIGWWFIFGPWAIATFIELIVGSMIYDALTSKNES